MPGGRFTFGPYQLDLTSKQFLRDQTEVILPAAQFSLLGALVENAPNVVRKEPLVKVAWQDVAVNDGSLHQAMSKLRATLDKDDAERYIQTVSRQGYRFVAPVMRVNTRLTDAELEAIAAPHRAFIDGRAALESLERDRIAAARRAFEQLIAYDADHAGYRIGFACACALEHESTRAEGTGDRGGLALAVEHAREACRIAPNHAEAWATRGFVAACARASADAATFLRRAVELDDTNWHHHVRLSYVTWGQERLQAAKRALATMPGCPIAHWLAATVLVARGMLAEAEREVDAGIAARTNAPSTAARFTAVGLYWLKGLLCLARDADDEAMAAFERELALEGSGHLYARECCANTWYAIGALRLRRRDTTGARAAFAEAIARVFRHPMATAALAVLGDSPRGAATPAAATPASVEIALARAVMLVAGGDVRAAAARVSEAIVAAPPSSAGWLVPIEPMLAVLRDPVAWAAVLTQVRDRAM